MENRRILNVKLPFTEAIEHLKNDEDAVACICGDEKKHTTVMIGEGDVLCVTKDNIFEINGHGFFQAALLTVKNVLEDDWYLIIEDKTEDKQ